LGILIIFAFAFFYLGITLTIIGTGFFKYFLQWSFIKSGDSRRDAGFGLFYSGINIGALLGGAVCVYLGTSPDYGWSYAFLSAAIVMVIGLITFLTTKHSLGP
jgi:POT family proton-dependent oligopeptide transporter